MKELRLPPLRNSNFQNLVFEAQLKTFLFHGKIMFSSWNTHFFISNHSINFKISDVMMSFWMHLLNYESFGHETSPSNRKICRNILHDLEDWILSPGLFWFTNLSQSIKTKYEEFVVFNSFEGLHRGKQVIPRSKSFNGVLSKQIFPSLFSESIIDDVQDPRATLINLL